MAFGGAIAAIPAAPTGEGPQQKSMQLIGLTLAAFVGAPDIAAADTGELVTATAVANQNQIPTTFGKGPGNWLSGDESLVRVHAFDMGSATQGVSGQVPYPHPVAQGGLPVAFVVGGNLSILLHNKGLQACGALVVYLEYKHSIVR